MLTLALALLTQAAASLGEPVARLRASVVSATRAVEGDSATRLRRFWEAREARDPTALLGLATLARLTYDYARADRLYLRLQSRAPRRPSAAHLYATLGLGLSRAARLEFGAAIPLLESARIQAEGLGDPRASVEARLSLAAMTARTMGLDSARAILAAADAMSPSDDPVLLARTRCAQGTLLRSTHLPHADSLAADGLRLARTTNDRRAIGACLMAVARDAQADALVPFSEAQDLLRAARDEHSLAAVRQWLDFHAVQYAANFWKGRDLALSAIEGGRRTGNVAAEAWARLNLAQLGIRKGDVGAARAPPIRREPCSIGSGTGLDSRVCTTRVDRRRSSPVARRRHERASTGPTACMHSSE